MLQNDKFYELLDKYAEGNCTPEETLLVERWYAGMNEDNSRVTLDEEILEDVKNRLRAKIILPEPEPGFWVKYRYQGIAASILLFLSIGLLVNVIQNKSPGVKLAGNHTIVPGSDKAVLTLAGGKSIDLSASLGDSLSKQTNSVVQQLHPGEISISKSANAENSSDRSLNTLTIPKGGKWKLILRDGTAVWLNAATILKFPTVFLGNKREIYLEGEAYFEVAKDRARPFIVHSGTQSVEVLGTHFNVNTYPDEILMKTTLLEGSVRLNGTKVLKPGQQSIYDGQALTITRADVEQAVAWKNNNFIFNGSELVAIMRQISRWYNVDVIFENEELKHITFSGSIPRTVSISTILRRLSLTKEMTFMTEQGKIIVKPFQDKL